MRKIFKLILCVGIALLATSCNRGGKAPYNLGSSKDATVTIPYEELGGVKVIPVKLNGVAMNMIYDTGCEGIHLSLNEVQTLYKNGKLDSRDFYDVEYISIADGSIVESGSINIREILIGEGEGRIVLHNKKATVSLNQIAPVLLGNTVLDELASIEVDNMNKTINFHKR